MIVVFVKNKHILPKNITNTIDKYFFICLPMAKEEENAMEKIVLSIYKNNIQINKEKDFLLL